MDRDPNEQVEGLISWLRGQGFQQVREDYSDLAFGNWVRELHGPDVWIRVVRDRGEWFFEATVSGSTDWFGINAWSECLTTRQVIEGISPRDQSEFLRQHLKAMKERASGNRTLLACLEDAQRHVQARRIGPLPNTMLGQTMKLAPPADAAKAQQEAAARLARKKHSRRKR
jgi:hypothetical protein